MAASPARARPAGRSSRTTLSVRPARRRDLPDLLRIENASFRSYYRPHRFTEADFLAYLARRNTLALVAHSENTILGYALGPAPLSGRPRTARLDSIAVVPGRRGHGVGRRLLARFMSAAKARGCRRMWLEVAALNMDARRLFEAAAFRPIRTLARYYSDSADAVRLRAAL